MNHVLFRIFFSFLSEVGGKVINRRKNYFLITICLNVQNQLRLETYLFGNLAIERLQIN
ncbi:hypothetical protein IGI66_002307 [Enterococcus sp. AZ048]